MFFRVCREQLRFFPSFGVIWRLWRTSFFLITIMRINMSMRRSQLAKYVSVFNVGLQNTFVYRWNYFLRALFALIPLAGTIFLWRAIFQERGGGLHGYDYASMIYYY